MKTLQQALSELREYIDEPSSDSEIGVSALVTHLNNEFTKGIAVAIRKRAQDYFGRPIIIPLVTNTYEYVIPRGQIRACEILKSGVTDGGNDVYTVAYNAKREELIKQEFDERNTYVYQPQLNAITGSAGYYQFGNKLMIGDGTPDITTGYYLRIYLLPSLEELHYGTMVEATATTIVISTATEGSLPLVSNSYLNYGVKIYSGTGINQERQITGHSYDPSTGYHTLTVPTWSTTPDGTVVYSITPPFEPEFEDAWIMGAALRSKIGLEDPLIELAQMYQKSLNDALDMITPRNREGVRRIRRKSCY